MPPRQLYEVSIQADPPDLVYVYFWRCLCRQAQFNLTERRLIRLLKAMQSTWTDKQKGLFHAS